MAKELGVDIGGTKIRIAIVEQDGRLSFDKKIPTELPLYPYLEQQLLGVLADHPEIEAIGIGTHGFIDPVKGYVIYATETLPGWTGTPVKRLLEKATGRRVEVDNDANCAALAEAKFGAAKGYSRIVCLTLGTGLGGGILWDGKLLNGGPHGGAAEIGHMILHPGGVRCTCGRRGCFEQYLSGTALKRKIWEAELKISPQQLFESAQSDKQAARISDEFTTDLAVAISTLQAAFDMEVLVIGGGVSDSAPLWIDQMTEKLKGLQLHPLDIRIAHFGNEAGVLGAALLVQDNG
ncbi:ROK family protein [Planococcus salinus]|uniref:ROK family protein n=1 Tax=Planococcus salinus TaxID=1848460 RepID=A0A3M8P5U1_9BACL|nr:ROK family protein [Planococcus salinus]RNF39056.1 ROK family protein [Planococcus salinus]